jgi:predicted nucleic acid-binding protein
VPEPGYLVDSNVFLRWFVRQIGWEHAREIRGGYVGGTVVLETVDSVRVELAHVLRTKGLLLGRLSRDQYLNAVRVVDDLDIAVHTTDADALSRAAALAADRSLRVFDALVVDRALQRGLPLLTSDVKLVRAVGGLLPTELLRGLDGSR